MSEGWTIGNELLLAWLVSSCPSAFLSGCSSNGGYGSDYLEAATGAAFLILCGSFDLDQQSGLRGAERSCDARYEASFQPLTLGRPPLSPQKAA